MAQEKEASQRNQAPAIVSSLLVILSGIAIRSAWRASKRSVPPSPSASPPPLTIEKYVDLYKVYRAYVMEESGLINSRLTWIITINGFLYASYGFTLQKQIDLAKGVKEDDIYTALFYDTMLQTELFLLTVCVVGVVIGIFGYVSIKAAQNASFAVADIFNNNVSAHEVIREGDRVGGYKTVEGYTFPHIRGGGNPSSLSNAHRPSRWMPLLFAYSWIVSAAALIYVWLHNPAIYGNLLFVFEQIIEYIKANNFHR